MSQSWSPPPLPPPPPRRHRAVQPGRFAADTDVPAERSRAEVERTLQRYGADQFMYGWKPGGAQLGFKLGGRFIRMAIPLPDRKAREFMVKVVKVNQTSSREVPIPPEEGDRIHEQATRQRWRAVALVIKAKLEAVESGISTVEHEFLAQTILPDGKTVAEFLEPQVVEAYRSGKMPTMLPGLGPHMPEPGE